MGEALQDATNLNWKNKSSKLAKNKTANMRHENKFSNVMTEEDLDRLFQRSKEKHNLKTETRD